MNTRLLDALKRQNHGRPPVWLMRQAGRYMPEYRALREGKTFLDMCRNPELAAQITRLPLQMLDVDAAILFADILLVADAFDRGLFFEEGRGPVFNNPVRNAQAVNELPVPDVTQDLSYVGTAVRMLLEDLKVPLIGFAGAPFTVASYMVEGGSSKDLKQCRRWMWCDPESFHRLLDKITDATIAYLQMQIDAGVQALQLFDTWAGGLTHAQFGEFVVPYHQRIVDALAPSETPVILFCRGSALFADQLASVGAAGVSVDWSCDLPSLRKRLGPELTLQGNFDPHLLYASPAVIRSEVHKLLGAMQEDPAYIVNLGHGVMPDMRVDHVRCFVDAVKDFACQPV